MSTSCSATTPRSAPPSASSIAGAMQFNVGRPSTLGSGQEQLVSFAFSFQGLPFAVPGRYLVRLTLDDDPVRGVPFAVHVEQVPTFRGPAAAGPV